MKSISLFSLALLMGFTQLTAQQHVNVKNGFAAQGYDVVSYFQEGPLKGKKEFTAQHEGISYKFYSEENLQAFQGNPSQYLPQYGGFCAYAVAKDGKKVSVNPKTYTISEGKLYLFYNSWGVNTLEKWNREDPETLQRQADSAWETILDSQ